MGYIAARGQNMKINIIGNGVFGSFIARELEAAGCEITPDADVVLLAVPAAAFEEVAANNADKLLVNLCSVQHHTNKICEKYSDRVLGLHPMFGPKTPIGMRRTCLITRKGDDPLIDDVIREFEKIGCEILSETPEGEPITGEWHDQLMANSHLVALEIAEAAAPKLRIIKDVPESYLPASVVRLRQLVEQLQDMPEGTRESILSNTYSAISVSK